MGGRERKDRRVAVIDGANVAHEEKTAEGKPKVSNLVAVRRLLEEEGFDPIVIVDATLRHEIDDPQQLEALFDDQRVRQAPAGTDADLFVLQTAKEFDGLVVSNDRYDRYRNRYAGQLERLIPVMIVRGEVVVYPDAVRTLADES